MLAAVRQEGLALQYASVDLRADVDIVSEAVGQNSKALKYVLEGGMLILD